MRKQSYIEFSDMRVFWDKKTDTIRITSGDPDLASKGWSLTLNRASKDERVLREALIESGIIPEPDNKISIVGQPGYGKPMPNSGVHIARQDGGYLMNEYTGADAAQDKGWIGPYLGHTEGSTKEPVFFAAHAHQQELAKTAHKIGYTTRVSKTPVSYDLHADIRDNYQSGCLMLGAPGSGKSAAVAQLVYQMVTEAEAQVVHIGIGGEPQPLANIPDTEILHLADYPGLLSPYLLTDNLNERRNLLTDLIFGLIPRQGFMRAEVNGYLNRTIEAVEASGKPSMRALVAALTDADSRYADTFLGVKYLMDLPFADLIFGEPGDRKFEFGDRLSLIIGNVPLPPQGLPPESYAHSDRIGLQIMNLLMYRVRQAFFQAPRSARKALVIDPAANVTATPAGQKLVQEIARVGRSLNIALVLTQTTADGMSYGPVLHAMNGKMIFRTIAQAEIITAEALLGIEDNSFNRRTIRNLRDGECLFMHGDMREPVTVQIELAEPLRRWLTEN